MKKHFRTVCFCAALIAFTVYLALDTFVLSTVYSQNADGMNTSMFTSLAATASRSSSVGDEAVESDGALSGAVENSGGVTTSDDAETSGGAATADGTSYADDNVSVTLTEYEYCDTTVYVADVTLSSAYYLRSAFAEDVYAKNVTETTSTIAEENGAILAVNGDFYGTQEKGYVIRNGVVYRDTPKGAQVLCVFADGTMDVVDDSEYTASELVDMGVWQAFTFGPALVDGGEIAVSEGDEVGKAKASNPRTAIGMIGENHFVFVVSDGRTDESEGLSLYELAQFMQSLGVKEAYNLDGGGSSTMYFNGEVVNNPTSGGRIKEREVSDIVYIGS